MEGMARKQWCDILISDGLVVDGSGGPPRSAQVAVRDDRIAGVGELAGWRAARVIQAEGLAVAPGFIDMHSHSDLSLLINPLAESKLRQGVTTEVIGQCGFSPAPAPAASRERLRAMFGFWGHEVEWTWGSFSDYLASLRSHPTSVNVVPVAGHGVIRAVVMGEENRAPCAEELAAMRVAVREAMEQGARGLSTGLVYAPSMFATTEEVIALAREMAPMNGIYFSHIRGEADGLLSSIAEAVEIGRQAGVPVQIAHMKTEGRENWGKAGMALEAIERARAEGVEVTYDVYPYTAWHTGLAQLLPAWAREGGVERMLARLREPGTRAKVQAELAAGAAADPGRWERRMISAVETEANRALQGRTLAEISERRRGAAEEVVIDLLVEEQGHVSMVGFGMDEGDVKQIIAHPVSMIGSDAAAVAPYGTLGLGHPHPRAYGTFPRVLGRYVREEKALSLEAAVAKMTARPAAKLGLADRGRIAEGMAADLVVFDPQTVADRATYQQPQQYPIGIHYVIVNGVIELEGEKHNERLAGRVLARGA
jgi:N-acyl-D-amino-acid deacylase